MQLCSVQCAVCSVQCAVCSVQCVARCVCVAQSRSTPPPPRGSRRLQIWVKIQTEPTSPCGNNGDIFIRIGGAHLLMHKSQNPQENCTNALKCRESLQSRGQNWQKQVLIRRFDPKILKTDMLGFSQHSREKSMTKRF